MNSSSGAIPTGNRSMATKYNHWIRAAPTTPSSGELA